MILSLDSSVHPQSYQRISKSKEKEKIIDNNNWKLLFDNVNVFKDAERCWGLLQTSWASSSSVGWHISPVLFTIS